MTADQGQRTINRILKDGLTISQIAEAYGIKN
jgi:hypothetical protein